MCQNRKREKVNENKYCVDKRYSAQSMFATPERGGHSASSRIILSTSSYGLFCFLQQWPPCIAWKHWPDTHEFITSSAEFWNTWVRLSCYYSRGYISCPLETHVTPTLQYIGPFRSFRSIFVYNTFIHLCQRNTDTHVGDVNILLMPREQMLRTTYWAFDWYCCKHCFNCPRCLRNSIC